MSRRKPDEPSVFEHAAIASARYPCVEPIFESQVEAAQHGRELYVCLEGHWHVGGNR